MAMLNMNGDADDDEMRDLDEGTAAQRPRGYRGAVGLANLGAFVRASLTRCVADVPASSVCVLHAGLQVTQQHPLASVRLLRRYRF